MSGLEYSVRENIAKGTTDYTFSLSKIQQATIMTNKVMDYMIDKTVELIADKIIEDCKLNVYAKIDLNDLVGKVATEMAKRIADSILENVIKEKQK